MPRSTRPSNNGDPGSSTAAQAGETEPPSAPASIEEQLRIVINQLTNVQDRLTALEVRDQPAAADAAPQPPLSAEPAPTRDEYVDWKNFYNALYLVLPLISMFKPDMFNLHTEETHDALIEQGKKGAAREYQALYCASFHLDSVLEYLNSITEDPAPPEMLRVLNSLTAILQMLTARMAVIQVHAATPRGHFTEGYAAYVEQRAYSGLSAQRLINPDHQAWHADFLRMFGDQQVRQIARNSVPQSGGRSTRAPSAPPSSSSRPARRQQPPAPPAAEG